MPFFRSLEEEIAKAKFNDKKIYIQFDANSKLGPDVIKGDPHTESENGKILNEIIRRNALVVMNSIQHKCNGLITRRRVTKKVNEESIIDFVLVCEGMEEIISEVLIDEEKKYVLTRYTKTKNGFNKKESDHNTIITYIKSHWNKKKNISRVEMYNFKDPYGLKMFKEMTSNDKFLSQVFEDKDKQIEGQTKKFPKRFGYCLSRCFIKIRIRDTYRNKALQELFNKRRILRTKKDDESCEALEKVEKQLSDMCAEDNLKLIKEACGNVPSEDGGMKAGKLWQLKKKLRSMISEPPTAMLDQHGNLVTTNKAIEELTLKMYGERLKALQIKDEFKVHKMQRENLCDQQLKEAQSIITPEWNIDDLEIVLKQLKKNKSRDPLGFANELFRPNNAGKDLKLAILKMMNKIKVEPSVSDILKRCNISSIYKRKGSRNDFSNYMGIFRVTILREVLDNLIYNDEYQNIDDNLTDSNVGA